MLLRNHGVVCCGETIEEAWYNTYHTILACETQVTPQHSYRNSAALTVTLFTLSSFNLSLLFPYIYFSVSLHYYYLYFSLSLHILLFLLTHISLSPSIYFSLSLYLSLLLLPSFTLTHISSILNLLCSPSISLASLAAVQHYPGTP